MAARANANIDILRQVILSAVDGRCCHRGEGFCLLNQQIRAGCSGKGLQKLTSRKHLSCLSSKSSLLSYEWVGSARPIAVLERRSIVFIFSLLLFYAMQGSAQQPASAPTVKPPALTAEQLERLENDWANLERYREADAQMPAPAAHEERVVFMGDSITEGWGHDFGNSFPGKPYINRGISGQTSPQMLVRFHQDVVDLKPRVVIILAGTNDIAGNTGKTTLTAIMENIDSMSTLARANGIAVVLCSVLPAKDFGWHHGLDPRPKSGG